MKLQLKLFVGCVAALVLSACGGGGGEVAQAPRPLPLSQQTGADPTTATLRVFQAFRGRAPNATEFRAFPADSMTLGVSLAASAAGASDASLIATVLTNMGVTAQTVNADSLAILDGALRQYFAAYGASARGVIVNNLVGLLAGLEADATWGASARGFNTNIANARAVIAASTGAGGACTPTVVTGFAGEIETTAANSGAGDGGSSGSGGGAAAGGGLGKVLGGAMTVTDLSTGNVVGQGVTDSATGLVTIRTCSLSGPFLLTLEGRSGAKYFDEGLNQLTDFGPGNTLHALVDRWDEHVGVSPLTEAAYRYALNNFKVNSQDIRAGRTTLRVSESLTGLTAAQVQASNELVRAAINTRLTTNYQLPSATALPTPVDASSPSNAMKDSRYGRSAAVNGGLVQAAQYYNPAIAQPALALTDQLARDLTDGRINGFALDGTQVAAADKTSYESVRLPLGATIATNAISGRFAQGTLLPQELRIEEEAGLNASQVFGGSTVQCNGFIDEIALMSDRSVTVLRRFPTNINGVCSFKFDAAENARVIKIKNFLTNVKGLSTGSWVAFALKTDGTVWGWGNSECGKLGPQFSEGIYSQPQLIEGLRDITGINTSFSGGVARDKTGSVYNWGSGGGSRPGRDKLCATGGIDPVTGQAFNRYHTSTFEKHSISNVAEVYIQNVNYFAVSADGIGYGWGEGFAGLLGNSDGTVASGTLNGPPVVNATPIPGLPPVRQLAFFNQTAFALLVDGTVMAWGDDAGKLLGNGAQRRTLRPTLVPGLSNIAAMAASYGGEGLRFQRHDGAVLAWGGAVSGLRLATELFTPTVVPTPEPIRHIVGRGFGFSVFFSSGKLGRDVNSNVDVTPSFR